MWTELRTCCQASVRKDEICLLLRLSEPKSRVSPRPTACPALSQSLHHNLSRRRLSLCPRLLFTSDAYYAQGFDCKAGLGLGPDHLGHSPERVEEKSSVFISGSIQVLYSTHLTSILPRPVTNVADANWYVLLLSTACLNPHCRTEMVTPLS